MEIARWIKQGKRWNIHSRLLCKNATLFPFFTSERYSLFWPVSFYCKPFSLSLTALLPLCKNCVSESPLCPICVFKSVATIPRIVEKGRPQFKKQRLRISPSFCHSRSFSVIPAKAGIHNQTNWLYKSFHISLDSRLHGNDIDLQPPSPEKKSRNGIKVRSHDSPNRGKKKTTVWETVATGWYYASNSRTKV